MAEELLDIVDEDNRVIRQEIRQAVHRFGWWHRGVHVFLFTPNCKLLVQRRSHGQDTYPGALDCSVSEHLKAGESYRQGAIRGLREELGVERPHLTRLLQFKMNYGPGDNMINELYQGSCPAETLTINHHEISHIAYHTIPELERMILAGEVPFTSWFVQLLRWYTGKPAEMLVLWCRR